jgi:hypothetical protein
MLLRGGSATSGVRIRVYKPQELRQVIPAIKPYRVDTQCLKVSRSYLILAGLNRIVERRIHAKRVMNVIEKDVEVRVCETEADEQELALSELAAQSGKHFPPHSPRVRIVSPGQYERLRLRYCAM